MDIAEYLRTSYTARISVTHQIYVIWDEGSEQWAVNDGFKGKTLWYCKTEEELVAYLQKFEEE